MRADESAARLLSGRIDGTDDEVDMRRRARDRRCKRRRRVEASSRRAPFKGTAFGVDMCDIEQRVRTNLEARQRSVRGAAEGARRRRRARKRTDRLTDTRAEKLVQHPGLRHCALLIPEAQLCQLLLRDLALVLFTLMLDLVRLSR